MRSLTDIYPPFEDAVELYAVAFSEPLSELQAYQNESGHPGAVAQSVGNMARDFRVTQQSTKVAIDGDGVIVYRAGYGRGSAADWERVLREMAPAD